MIKYMHTIDGCPASWDVEQICYASTRRPIKLLNSLAEIKKERKKSDQFRNKHGWRLSSYGHFRVKA